MKNIILILFTLLLIISISCNEKKNNLFEHFKNKPEYLGNIECNPSQTLDSIVIIDTKKTITTTGTLIFEIITRCEKRRQDSLTALWIKNPFPYNPETRTLHAEQREKSLFTICIYDSLGDEITKPVNDNLSAGEYFIDYSVLSIFPPGKYFYEIKCYNYESVRQFGIHCP